MLPDSADLYVDRGVARFNIGEWDDSLSDYDTALRIRPDSTRALVNRGIVKRAQGRHESAIEDYSAALKIDATCVEAFYNRGKAKYNMGKFEEATADYTAAMELKPDNGKAYLARAASLYSADRFQDAISDCSRAIEIMELPRDRKNMAHCYYYRALAFAALADRVGALESLRKAVELDPGWIAYAKTEDRFGAYSTDEIFRSIIGE
jgi:tetratricopeptide (TPR) repeat protein